jgi:hypothetical protein
MLGLASLYLLKARRYTAEPDLVGPDRYSCTCLAGYANGVCIYDYIVPYQDRCSVMNSRHPNPWNSSHIQPTGPFSGNCDMDVDECQSFPCENGGTCSESASSDPSDAVTLHAYRCVCVDGWSNGLCEYDFLENYATPISGNVL